MAGSKVCQVALAKYEVELPPLLFPYWVFRTYQDLSAALLALAVFLYFLPAVTRRFSKGRTFPIPRPLKDIALLMAASGTVVFAVCVFMDVVSTNPADVPNPLLLGTQLGANWTYYLDRYLLSGTSSLEVFGRIAFLSFALASSGAFVYRLGEGVAVAFAKALALFAAPLLIAFETILLLFTPVNMPIHVSALLVGTPLADVFTNWFVLVISTGVFACGLSRSRLPP